MTVLTAVTPYGRSAPSARVRVYDWLDRLTFDTTTYEYTDMANNSPRNLLSRPLAVASAEVAMWRRARREHDVLLLHRQASPFGRGEVERRFLHSAQFGVYDFDDALQWGAAGSRLSRLLSAQLRVCVGCIQSADRVIAGNDVLAEWAGQFGRDIVVIPSCVDPKQYRVKDRYDTADFPRLVWVGSFSTEIHLLQIEEALLEIHRQTGTRLTIIGAAHRSLGRLDAMTDRIQWQMDLAPQQLAEFDIGIAPLNDRLFSRGKCGYKLLQYGAAGLPFIASPVAANEKIGMALGGYLARSTADWVEGLTELLAKSGSERQHIGERARQAVERMYSFDAWHDHWVAALELSKGAFGRVTTK
jgi:glycosyltransferase involved in cell wall biosynthesis